MRPSDESYVIDLCDRVLGQSARRGHRFDWLRGDPNKLGRSAMLPVDAYYPELNLVVEYLERQHSEPVQFFDRRMTLSGVSRGEQRKAYDQRRRLEIPKAGLGLLEISYALLPHAANKRLLRQLGDEEIIRALLAGYR